MSVCKIYTTWMFSWAQFAYKPQYITFDEDVGSGLLEQWIMSGCLNKGWESAEFGITAI